MPKVSLVQRDKVKAIIESRFKVQSVLLNPSTGVAVELLPYLQSGFFWVASDGQGYHGRYGRHHAAWHCRAFPTLQVNIAYLHLAATIPLRALLLS
jgi:hypothetical protein